jgi:hypothetical protein
MKRVFVLALLIALCCGVEQAGKKTEEDDEPEAVIAIQVFFFFFFLFCFVMFLVLLFTMVLKDGFMLLSQDNFDDALEKNEITFIEFIKKSGKKSALLDELKASSNSPFGQRSVGFGRVNCSTDDVLCEELITKELTLEDARDVMVYQRDAMTAHIVPRSVPDSAESVIAWAQEELAKV